MRHFAQLEKKLGITVFPKEIRGGKVVTPAVDEEEVGQSDYKQDKNVRK